MILIFSLADEGTLEFPIEKKCVLIGRSKQCDIVLPYDGISRRHLQLDFEGEEVTVTDLKSINGVQIEGKKIPTETPVKYQTFLTLSFGPVTSVQISFDSANRPEASPTTAQPHISDSTQTKIHYRGTLPQKVKAKPKGPKKLSYAELESKLVNILVVILLLLVVAYFVTAKKPT